MKTPHGHYFDLKGPEGNAFALAGVAQTWAKQLEEPTPNILSGAESYEQVLDRFDALFKGRIDYHFLHDPRVEEPEDDYEYDDEA